MMKALVKAARGCGNVEIREVPEPVPDPGEVKVEVHASGVCGSDLHIYEGYFQDILNPPVIMGHEFAGVISELGEGVTNFSVGQRVTSETSSITCGDCLFCRTGNYNLCPTRKGLGYYVNGSFAKYVVVPTRLVHTLPSQTDFQEGALLEPLSCCVKGVMERISVHARDLVVITGPGLIGLLCLQVALAEGGRVLMVGAAGDEKRLQLAEKLGSETTLIVGRDNILATVQKYSDQGGADIMIECSGAPAAAKMGIELLRRLGQYLQMGIFGRSLELSLDQVLMKELTVTGSFGQHWTSWRKALQLVEQGRVHLKPLISHVLPLNKWEEAFNMHGSRDGLKVILTPID